MKKRVLLIFFILSLISSAMAEEFKNISAADLKKMLDKKTTMVLVDARTWEEYSQEHIPNAVNIPPDQLGSIGTLLPKDKKIPLVFYCRGVG